jgi:hypothetical protein
MKRECWYDVPLSTIRKGALILKLNNTASDSDDEQLANAQYI